MTRFLFFLGRFHVLVLHLPIGIIAAAVCMDLLAQQTRYRHLRAASTYLWGATAVTAVVTVVLGYFHSMENTFDGPTLDMHRLYGTSVAVIAGFIWLGRYKWGLRTGNIAIPAGIGLLALVILTGHYGGNLTHGSTYLVEYAPDPLRRLAGLGEMRPAVHDVGSADPYLDVVQPLLKTRCGTCHNDDKRSGGLSVSSYERLLAGGDTGPVIARGNIEDSELHRRITLRNNDEDFMPAEGKTPLTERQVAILTWWIGAGAPTNVTFADLSLDSSVEVALRGELGFEGASAKLPDTQPALIAVDPHQIDELFASGLVVRQLSEDDRRLVVSSNFRGDGASQTKYLELLRDVAPNVVELNLQRAGLDDSAIEFLSGFSQLTQLRLDNNKISDVGVAALSGLDHLKYLNLYGNSAVTDASIDLFANLKSLERLYIWETGITADGLKRLRERRSDLTIEAASSPFPRDDAGVTSP